MLPKQMLQSPLCNLWCRNELQFRRGKAQLRQSRQQISKSGRLSPHIQTDFWERQRILLSRVLPDIHSMRRSPAPWTSSARSGSFVWNQSALCQRTSFDSCQAGIIKFSPSWMYSSTGARPRNRTPRDRRRATTTFMRPSALLSCIFSARTGRGLVFINTTSAYCYS